MATRTLHPTREYGPAYGSDTPVPGPTKVAPSSGAVRKRLNHWPLVIVIDGDASYREALASVLNQEGFVVECAADGDQGLRLIQKLRPDLVLLDISFRTNQALSYTARSSWRSLFL